MQLFQINVLLMTPSSLKFYKNHNFSFGDSTFTIIECFNVKRQRMWRAFQLYLVLGKRLMFNYQNFESESD